MYCRRFAVCALLLLIAVPAPASEKPWTEIRSPHFRLLTDGSVQDARKVIFEFEQLRYVFATRFPNARLESAAPFLIFAVRDEETANQLEPHLWKSGANRAGEFHHGWEKQYTIVLLDSWGGEGSKEIVYHEYTHSFEHMNLHYVPLWLDEGTAEFFAYTRFEEHRIYLGAPTERYRTMRKQNPIPVESFITLNSRSPYYLDGSKNHLFYAEAWALVHFLTYGPGMENGKRLDQFIALLQQRVEQKKAFQQIFGDFNKIDKALQAYMLQPTFASSVLRDPPKLDEKNLLVRSMSAAETESELAGFHIWTHDFSGAQALLDEALKDDPKLALAHENGGFLAFSEGNDDLAAQEFTEACRLDGGLYLSLFYKTMLSREAASNSVGEMNEYGSSLGKVLQLNPYFAPAYVQLARLALRENDLASALAVSRKAEELEPSRAGYHLLTGQIERRLGNGAAAADSARYVADRWVGPDHNEAVELWNSVPEVQRPAGEPLIEALPPDTKSVEGTVGSVTCNDHGLDNFVLTRQGQAMTFLRKGGFAAGYSDTLWFGGDHFSLCHHLQGLRAVVRYRPASDGTYAGDISEIEIRDNMPEPLKEQSKSAHP